MTNNPRKEYLGDSVYIEDHGFQIRLTTENGFGPSNEIFLEDSVVYALFDFIQRSRGVEVRVIRKSKQEQESV